MLKDQIFADKRAKVVVVEGVATNRALISEIVRSIGFNDVTGVPNLQDAIGVLESEKVDWLISGLTTGGEENALQFLRLATLIPELRNLRISLLVEDAETPTLPLAFQWGLFSCHKKPFTKESLTAEMKTFITRCDAADWHSTLISAEYLRSALHVTQRFNDLVELEKSLIKLYPSRTELLINLAKAYKGASKLAEAAATLKQVEIIQPDLKDVVKQTRDSLFHGDAIDPDDKKEKFNFLNIENVVYVDSDSNLHNNVKELLAGIGVTNVHCFADGEAALEHIKANPNPDVIIQEWRIPKVTGPLFIQRAKMGGAPSAIYIVVSSLVQKDDLPLLKEMGAVDVVEKPFERHQLLKSLVWAVQQDRLPSEQSAMERKIRRHLKEKNLNAANELKLQYLADPKIPLAAKAMLEAEIAYFERHYEKAKIFAIDALRRAGDSIMVLNLLGKVFVRLRDFGSALKCFEKAQTIAPMNIERLCIMAEVQSEIGDFDKAREVIGDAKKIDEENPRVTEAEAKVELNAGNTETAKKLLGQLEALDNVVSYMNNQAVTFARSGNIDKGIEQYTKTISSIPDDHGETKAIVTYNLALAYARVGKLTEAKQELEKISQFKVLKKSKSLLAKVDQSITSGQPIAIHTESKPAEIIASAGLSDQEIAAQWKEGSARAALEIRRGEIGCYMIFIDQKADDKMMKFLEKPLRFKSRDAIERDESRGADKNFKAS